MIRREEEERNEEWEVKKRKKKIKRKTENCKKRIGWKRRERKRYRQGREK